MARVSQDPVQNKMGSILPGNSPTVGRAVNASTSVIKPTPISTSTKVDRGAVINTAIASISREVMNFANQQSVIEQKNDQIRAKQEQEMAANKARGQLLLTTDNIINQIQSMFDPVDFNPDAAKDAVRSAVFDFIASDAGTLVPNDTLRLVLQEADKRIDDLTPKTTIRFDEGRAIIMRESLGQTSFEEVIVDQDVHLKNMFEKVGSIYPGTVERLFADPKMSNERREEILMGLAQEQSDIESFIAQQKLGNTMSPARFLSEPLRKEKATQLYMKTLRQSMELVAGTMNHREFDQDEPGALIALADEVDRMGAEFIATSSAAADYADIFFVEMAPLVNAPAREYIKSYSNHLRSLDVLNEQKTDAESATALATTSRQELSRTDTEFAKRATTAAQRWVAKGGAGILYLDTLTTILAAQGKPMPTDTEVILAIGTSRTEFSEMAESILQLPEEIDPQKDVAAVDSMLSVLNTYFLRTISMAKGDVMEAADVEGYVNTIKLIRENPVFKQHFPDHVQRVEAGFEAIKANPNLGSLIELFEKDRPKSGRIRRDRVEVMKAKLFNRGS